MSDGEGDPAGDGAEGADGGESVRMHAEFHQPALRDRLDEPRKPLMIACQIALI